MKEFSEVEADSAWQYFQALQYTDNTEIRRMLFNNVLEERNHADIFHGLHRSFKVTQSIQVPKRRLPLIRSAKDLPDFLAFVHVGEASVHGKFVRYANKAKNTDISRAFQRISEDEEGHESETLLHLTQLAGGPEQAKRKIVKAKIRHGFKAFSRHSEKVGNVILGLILSLIFFVFGLLARLGSAKKVD